MTNPAYIIKVMIFFLMNISELVLTVDEGEESRCFLICLIFGNRVTG